MFSSEVDILDKFSLFKDRYHHKYTYYVFTKNTTEEKTR